MMRQYELVERVLKYKPNADEGLLNRAYVYGMQKHGLQKRASGDPYFSHPLEVAAILTDMKLDEATIAVALLHDTIEDTDATRIEIDKLFGEEIGKLVEGLTKIQRIDFISKKTEQAENLRRLLLAIADDLRVLLVKLADRLHNMRTLQHMREDKRKRISEETMEIYAPLAGRMGMQDVREELEQIAFSYLYPDAFETISQKLSDMADESHDMIANIKNELIEKLKLHKIDAVVKHRQKRPYSVFRKIENKAIALDQLSDIFGFRVLVDNIDQCYETLGIVHTTWAMVPGRFKDFISTPKQNDYQSIHTTIVGPSRQRVELQIRTNDMDQIAEYGIAAHALYKEGHKEADDVSGDERNHGVSKNYLSESRAYSWLRHTVESLSEGDTPEHFLEHTKLELFYDQVFCFTPKGKLIALPNGATVLDFAYAVHTDVGNNCIGCKINGKDQRIHTELNNGDEVEIICGQNQLPSPLWQNFAVTGKARFAIRRALRETMLEQNVALGERILLRAFDRVGKTLEKRDLELALPGLARKTIEEVYSDVGRGELYSYDVLRAVFPDYQDERVVQSEVAPVEEGWFRLSHVKDLRFKVPGKGSQPLDRDMRIAMGISDNIALQMAEHGGVVPGERIIGILQPNDKIIIYPIHAIALKRYESEPHNWLDVRWVIDEQNYGRYRAGIVVDAINEPGTLAIIAGVVANNDSNIHELSMESTAPDFTRMKFDLEVWDLKHLSRVMKQLAKKDVVRTATRIED